MSLVTEKSEPADEYEAVALPPAPPSAGELGAAVFLRRCARPTRRAVLHLRELAGSFAPPDLVRWYNERGFHFYVTDLDSGEAASATSKRRPSRSLRRSFAALDAARAHMRVSDGIDAIILSAQESLAVPAALWCDARDGGHPVDALILTNPEFGRVKTDLGIGCPVLVISSADPGRSSRRDLDAIRLGQHVTCLYMREFAEGNQAADPAPAALRRRLFDEMGRWLGAYMYGQVRDQLL